MKKIFTLLIVIVFSLTVLVAQEAPPQAFSFKATIQGTNGQTVVNKMIRLRISILQDDTNGFPSYSEFFTPTTNHYSQVDVEIGRGNVLSGIFPSIDWSAHKYFLKVEVDAKGGTNYQLLSVTQLLSVPYALYAGNAGTAINESDPIFKSSSAFGITGGNISNWNTAYSWGNHSLAEYVTPDGVQTLTNKTLTSPIINSPTGIIKGDVGLGLVDNTPDLSKPISIATQTALDLKDNILTFNLPLNRATNIISLPPASVSNDGYMSSADKTKLEGLKNADGSETKITTGTNVTITGVGTDASPYVISSLGGSGNLTLSQVLVNGNDAGSKNISNVASPVNAQDAATKAYVDALEQRISAMEDILGITTLSDIDGNVYETVKIGKQLWMKENLKTTKLNNGTPIQNVTENSIWWYQTTAKYCWYENDNVLYGNDYGALYNYYTVNTGILCPTGWHVSTDEDWTTLITYLGGENVAAGKLKETGSTHWLAPNTGATNETGFTALPGGGRNPFNGSFYNIRWYGNWWSFKVASPDDPIVRYMSYLSEGVTTVSADVYKSYGFSVRCVKD